MERLQIIEPENFLISTEESIHEESFAYCGNAIVGPRSDSL